VTLYNRYQGPLYRFALHMSGNQAIAEEVVQETFMVLVRGPKNYDATKGELGAYLFGVARNNVRRQMNEVRMDVPIDEVPLEDEQASLSTDDNVLEELGQAEQLDALRRAILSLPEQYRETVVLCDLEELDYSSAATMIGCSQGTVASRLHRARAILKAKLSCLQCAK